MASGAIGDPMASSSMETSNSSSQQIVPSASFASTTAYSNEAAAVGRISGGYQQRRYLSFSRRHNAGRDLNLSSYLRNRRSRTYQDIDLTRIARNHGPFLQRLDYMKRLPVHNGCVNTIAWNRTGEYLLSGSDDCNLCVTKPGCSFDKTSDYTVLHKVQTRHLGNIFRAQFLPNSGDRQTVSCSSEGPIIVHDINSSDASEGLLTYNCHSETIFEVVPVPDDDKIFLSCGEDKTIRLFDMRIHNSCARAGTCPHPALIRNSYAVTTLNLHPLNSNLMLVGRADGLGLVYDRRKLPDVTKFTRERIHEARSAGEQYPSYHFKHPLEGVVSQFHVPQMDGRCRFTSLCYNRNGSEILASYSGDYIYLFSHDASSNMELIQTLPKKVNKITDDEQTSGDNNGNGGGHDGGGDGGGGGSSGAGGRTSRDPRISRIRVRGDWSDTGVNSVPHWHRRANGEIAHRPSFLERVAVRLNAAHNFDPFTANIEEAVALDFNNSSSSATTTNHPPSSAHRLEGVEEEEANDDDDDDDETSENSTLIDDDEEEEEDDDDDDDDDVSMMDDEEENYNYADEHYAANIVRSLVDEASQEAQSRMAAASSSSQMSSANETDLSDPRLPSRRAMTTSDQYESEATKTATSNGRPGISPKMKAKFRKTVDDLKAKYDRIPTRQPRVMYQGHRNSRTTFKEAIFWGDDYIMSGSDCGRIMVWEKESAQIVMGFKADERVVNCLAPNPTDYVLASSGIDYDIKLWSTQSLSEGPLKVSDEEMQRIVNNNELMLEESKHTLSVTPHLFFRVLASLVQSSR